MHMALWVMFNALSSLRHSASQDKSIIVWDLHGDADTMLAEFLSALVGWTRERTQ
jgi:hypothetical protein